MDGIINVSVNGYSISKDSNCAGAQYEANSTKLRIEFSEDWKGFAKDVTFWNALGENPTKIVLDEKVIENIIENKMIYLVPIPPEAMTEAGTIVFAIDGFDSDTEPNTVKRSVEDKLKVLPSRKADNATNSIDPTPSEIQQIQEEIDDIIDTIQEAKISADNAKQSETDAQGYADDARNSRSASEEAAAKATLWGQKAVDAVGKTSYVGDNGNWFEWDSEAGKFVDSGVRAQAGSMVYVGKNPPDDADIWLDPDGDTRKYVERKYIDLRSYWNETNPKFYMECSEVNFAVGDGIGETVYWLLVPSVFGVEWLSGYDYYVIHPLKVMREGNASGLVVVTQTLDGQERHLEVIPDGGGYWSEWTPVEDDVTKAIKELEEKVNELVAKSLVKTVIITLYASSWVADGNHYSQEVQLADATPYSKVDLQPTAEQLAIFHEKDITFVTENEGAVITVYCIGQKPTNDYAIQATITEVEMNE